MVQGCVLRCLRQPQFEHPACVGIAALHTQRVGGVQIRRHMARVERTRLRKCALGLVVTAQPRVERAERRARLGPVRRVAQRGDVLVGGLLPRRAPFRSEGVLLPGGRARGLDAHGAQRVGEQWRQQTQLLLRRQQLDQLYGREPQQRLRIARCALGGGGVAAAGLRQALDGGGAHDRCVCEIIGDRRQRGRRTRLSRLGGVKGRRESLESRGVPAEPAAHRGGGPLCVLLRVALVAGVRHAQRDRLVGARNPHAVIAPAVDDHVGRARHMALRALRAGGAGGVTVMRRRVVLARRVTLAADRVAVDAQLLCVRVVAVAAGHALAMHAALQPRAPDEDFVALLAVGASTAGATSSDGR